MVNRLTKTIATALAVVALVLAFAPVPARAEDIDATDPIIVDTSDDETPEHEAGWVEEEGVFRYFDADGTMFLASWVEEDGAWYYVNIEGVSLSEEWLKLNGKWYYFDADRVALSDGWLNYEGGWYHFNSDRSLTVNGWVQDGDAWYYCGKYGRPVVNSWVKSGGKWYYLGSDGKALANQRIYYKGTYYYLGSEGYCLTSSSTAQTGSLNALIAAAKRTPTTGSGGCASWVTAVFTNAGIGTWNGSARDMYNMYCTSSNRSELKPGMIIAVPSTGGTYAAYLYGHVGIYLGNGIVMHNLKGVVGTMSLDTWISYCGGYATPKWGWFGGVVLY